MKAIKLHCGHGKKRKEGSRIDIQSLRRRYSSTYRPIDEEIMDDRTFD